MEIARYCAQNGIDIEKEMVRMDRGREIDDTRSKYETLVRIDVLEELAHTIREQVKAAYLVDEVVAKTLKDVLKSITMKIDIEAANL